MRRHIGALAVAASLSVLGLIAQPAAASVISVSGSQAFASPGDPGGAACIAADPVPGGAPAVLTMSGSLVGCWYLVDLIDKFQDNGALQETGHELFVGCVDSGSDGSCSGDPTGTLSFSFVFTGKFDPMTFEEIKGRCHHHVDEGTDGFAQASGVINFKDVVEAGIATYNGNLKLASPSSNTTATNRSRTRRAAAPSAAC
jgi:hypothetical protein